MFNKKDVAQIIFDSIENNKPIDEEILKNKEFVKISKNVIFDFPLILESITKLKLSDVEDKEIVNKIEISSMDMIYFSDKTRYAGNNGRTPAHQSIYEPTTYLSTHSLSKNDLIDFSGNAGNAQFYKVIKNLMISEGTYLSNDYEGLVLSSSLRKRIMTFEKWYKNFSLKQEISIGDRTSQIAIPFNTDTGYVMISPAQSMGMINRLIRENKIFKDKIYENRTKIKKEIKILESKIIKTKNKNHDELKDLLHTKKEEEKHLPFLKMVKWQEGFTKTRNLSLMAPSSKDGIFYATAPNIDFKYNQNFLAKNNISALCKQTFKNLYFKNKNFKESCNNFRIFLDKAVKISFTTNAQNKEKVYSTFEYLFTSVLKVDDYLILNNLDDEEEEDTCIKELIFIICDDILLDKKEITKISNSLKIKIKELKCS